MKITGIDGFSGMGYSHKECQDAVLYGNIQDIYYGIACDGCSASHEICGQLDFGSKLLAYQAAKFIKANLGVFESESKNPSELLFSIIKEAKLSADNLGLHENALDATLLFFVTNGKWLHFFCAGDGACAIHHYKSDVSEMKRMDFNPVSAPLYPAYNLDEKRYSDYQKLPLDFNQTFSIETIEISKNDFSPKTKDVFNPDFSIYDKTYLFLDLEKNPISSFSIYSDGIFTQNYFDELDPQKMCKPVMVSDFETQFTHCSGQYIKRKFINGNKRRFPKKKWQHFDDLSIVGVAFEN